MANTTLASLVASLKFKSQVQPSEGFTDPADFVTVVQDAVLLHNSAYEATASSCTVPDREKQPVVLLAWSELCIIRASRFGAENTGSGPSGFGTDRNTPFYKMLELSKRLRKQYEEVCKTLELEVYAGGNNFAASSNVIVESLDIGAFTPLELSALPPKASLSAVPDDQINNDGTLLVKWACKQFQNFGKYILVYANGAEGLFQEWNINSKASVPRILDTAEKLVEVQDQDVTALKVKDLVTTSGLTHRLLLVVVSKSGKYSYSNEVVITQP